MVGRDDSLEAFREDVGPTDAVCVVGGRTSWHVGGQVAVGTREVHAPSGVRSFEPSELIVRAGAGTPLEELAAALDARGQCTSLSGGVGSTVGGVLAVGRSGLDALGRGPVRDALLEAFYVDSWGRLVRAGAPVVKNVSGFDLCRLLVGSLGTIGLFGEVVLRTRPRPAAQQWFTGRADVGTVWSAASRPASVLWDGTQVWVLLEGVAADIRDGAAALAGVGCGEECEGPPPLPPHRWSVPASGVGSLTVASVGRFVAQVGVGVVHASLPPPPPRMVPSLTRLHRAVKARFDPDGRLNPGRSLLPGAIGAGC